MLEAAAREALVGGLGRGAIGVGQNQEQLGQFAGKPVGSRTIGDLEKGKE